MNIGGSRIGYFIDYEFVNKKKNGKERKKIYIDTDKLRELLVQYPFSNDNLSYRIFGSKHRICVCLKRRYFFENDYIALKKHLVEYFDGNDKFADLLNTALKMKGTK